MATSYGKFTGCGTRGMKRRAMDRLSNLPEDIISRILSYLPAKYAVRTCILSHSWREKWRSIYNIHIDDDFESLMLQARSESFIDFVYHILNFPKTSTLISFRLTVNREYKSHHLTSWISSALSQNVQILEIDAIHQCKGVVVWSKCLSRCTSLTKLKLRLTCRLEVPKKDCFLHLKTLYISGGKEPTEILAPNSGRWILVFPVLEVLEMEECKWLNVKKLEIRAPELIRIKTSIYKHVNNCRIKIRAEKLAEFHSFGEGLMDNFVLRSPSLYYVALGHKSMIGILGVRVNMLLKRARSLKCLRLSGQVFKALLGVKSQHILPTFNHLKLLDLGTRCEVNELLELLHAAPSLEILKICTDTSDRTYDYGQVEYLPLCMSRLKEVTLLHFGTYRFEIEFEKFFLDNAINLEKMFIYGMFPRSVLENVIGQMLSGLPASSNSVSFFVDHLLKHEHTAPPLGL